MNLVWQCPHCYKFDLIVCEQTPVLESPYRAQYRLQPHEPEYICVTCVKSLKHGDLLPMGMSSDMEFGSQLEPSDVIFIMDEW